MERKATTHEERQKLLALGFVRVDGLQVSKQGRTPRSKIVTTIEPRTGDLGCWDKRSSLIAIYTSGGEIWMAANAIDPAEERSEKIEELLTEFCPNGRGVFVPGSNGDKFSWREILRRIANPDW